MKVFGRVPVGRTVAATYVPALEAEAEVHPVAVHPETFLTSFRCARLHVVNMIEVCTIRGGHGDLHHVRVCP
jgi:hypothetical protein